MANQKSSGGFSHEKVETNNFLMIVLILIVLAIGGLVEIVPLFFQKSTTEPIKGLQPYTALQVIGRDVYQREGCYNCHSQMIRPFRAETLRYGPYSPGLTWREWEASTVMNGIAFTSITRVTWCLNRTCLLTHGWKKIQWMPLLSRHTWKDFVR